MKYFLHTTTRIRILNGDLEWVGTPSEFSALEPAYSGLPAGMIVRYATPDYQYVSDGDDQFDDTVDVLQYCDMIDTYAPGSGNPASYINDAIITSDNTWSSSKIATEIASGVGAGGVGYVGEIRFGFWISSPDLNNWILCAGTIGNAVSGADYAGSQYQALFEHLYAVMPDAYAPVLNGRSGNAAADFTVGKTLTLPDFRGRAPIGAGQADGLTARNLGQRVGAESHSLSGTEGPPHSHDLSGIPPYPTIGSTHPAVWYTYVDSWYTINSNEHAGNGTPHNNMQPSMPVLAIIKY